MDGHEEPVHALGTACPNCGIALARTAVGEVCTACLFKAGMRAHAAERVGPYELLQPLDEGGTGVVYIARQQEQEGLLAIKIARPELLASADTLVAFRNGMRIQQALREQSNIVSIYQLGTHEDGRPYAVMPLLDGGTLADADVRKRYEEPRAALELTVKLAKAVHAAHQRGVLHCDIKPANVLFNTDGEPFVSDFGLARIVGRSAITRGAAFQGGTPGWMSPEQAQQLELTIASDVFSLGVLLYWLLARRLPFGDGEDFALRVAREQPAPPRAQSSDLRFELECICARAMLKRPEQRYRSVAELVDDLERARDGRPIEAERRLPVRRARKWIYRHKLAALAVVELSMLLMYLPLMPLSVFREIKGTVRTQISYAATAQAGAVMNELRATARRLEQLALEPEVKALVDHRDPIAPPAALVARATGNDGLSVFTTEGILRARWPAPRFPHPTYDFSFRDYFQGQLRFAATGRREVYVARAFHSTGDEEPMLALSTPLYEEDKYIGALIARTRAKATFGSVQMNCGARGTCMTALLGPRDRDPGDVDMPKSIFVLAAPGLADGQERLIDSKVADRICARYECQPAASNQFDPPLHPDPLVIENYEDPVSNTHSMAAVAPIGRTGLFVVVATPLDALDAVVKHMADRVKTFLWVPLLLGLVLLGGLMAGPWLLARARRMPRRR